jgi:cytochrome c oxidase subunit III
MNAMADIIPYRSPHTAQRTTAYIGMFLFIGAWAMMFACLFIAYAALRIGTPFWPPAGQPALPLGATGLNTLVIVASSLALEGGLWAIRSGKPRALAPALALTAALGGVFLWIQYGVGTELWIAGLRPDGGPYASVFYGLAGIHAAHLAVGLVALLWLALRAAMGAYNTPQHLPVRLWSMYWHFVGAVWVLMYLVVFVV